MRSVSIVGLGWLGLPLARYLKHLGWQVKGSKRHHEGVEQMRLQRLEAYHLELTPEINADPDDLIELLSSDALIINIPPSQYFFNLHNYVKSIQNLVNESLLHGTQHLIFISSTSVFPEQSGQFNETSLACPDSDVGRALLDIEQWLSTLQYVDCDILRLAGLIGTDRHPVYSLAGKENLKNGNTPINLVHLDDCLRAIQLLLETPSGQRLYHLVAPKHPSRVFYYAEMARKISKKAPHFICSESDPQRIITGQKICDELAFVYQHPDPEKMTL